MYFLGYDLGSSSVKVCLFDGERGRASAPEIEMTIDVPEPGWAEQAPQTWWEHAKDATAQLLAEADIATTAVGGIGISYQMHGLVLVDREGTVLRPAIIWCDSRAVDVGKRAFEALGERYCLETLLSSPGNFTASKLAWVRQHEPEVFARASKWMLPGDYFQWRLTGCMTTTVSGLSEGIFWDFSENRVASFLLEHMGLPETMIPDVVPTFGEQGQLTSVAARELGLPEGIPVTYRAGDQPNNALSLNVLEPGEVAASAGTSGVVYGVSDAFRADPSSRVNAFAHVTHSAKVPRLGILLCINGAGSANRWLRQTLSESYDVLNALAADAPAGAAGLQFFPFGNGAERMLKNRDPGAGLAHLELNIHSRAHLVRAVQEGVAFSFRYGMDIVKELGMRATVVRAGLANMFLSPVFRDALAASTGVSLELYRTDGAEGAARGAAIGAKYYASFAEAFAGLERETTLDPDPARVSEYEGAYESWARELEARLR